MYNTSAFAQNLQKVTRIHQLCGLHVEFMLKFWLLKVAICWLCWLAPFSRWPTFPSETLCFSCNASCLHICLHILHMLFIAFFHPGSRRRIVLFSINTLLIAHGISIQWWAMGPLDDWSCAALLCCGKQGANWENLKLVQCVFTFSPQRFHRRGAVVHFEDVDRKAGPTESLANWRWQTEAAKAASKTRALPSKSRETKTSKTRLCMVFTRQDLSWFWNVLLGGLERLVRYLSSAAFNLQTCIWNSLESCSFWSLTWLCWGFPVNQSASEFPVRSLDCRVPHDLQNWKEAEHCFWMKGEIGCTWWSALHSVLHIENIATRKKILARPIHLYTDDIDRDTEQQLINLSSLCLMLLVLVVWRFQIFP